MASGPVVGGRRYLLRSNAAWRLRQLQRTKAIAQAEHGTQRGLVAVGGLRRVGLFSADALYLERRGWRWVITTAPPSRA